MAFPIKKSFILCIGYRQWQLVGQLDKRLGTVSAQLKRWESFLDSWETAIHENKEVLVALDANIDHLTWSNTQ